MNRSRNLVPLVIFALALAIVALFWAVPRVYADDTQPPATTAPATPTATRPAECPDAPAPCAVDGYVDEYTDDNLPMEFDPDGRPVVCPPYPAVCAVPGYEDGPPYPQNFDVDPEPSAIPDEPILTPPGELPTLDPTLPNQTPPTPDPNGYLLDPPGPLPTLDPSLPNELNPDGADVRCPDAPAVCYYSEYALVNGGGVEDVADIGTPPVAPETTATATETTSAAVPGLPKTGR